MKRWPVWDIRDMATHSGMPLLHVSDSWITETCQHLIRTRQKQSMWAALYPWLVRTQAAPVRELHNLTYIGATLQQRFRKAEERRLRVAWHMRGDDLRSAVSWSNMNNGPQEMCCMRPLGGDGLVVMHEEALSPAFRAQLYTWIVDEEPRQPRASLGHKLRYAILKRDDFRCCLCGVRASDGPDVALVVDHKIAWTNGGRHDPENLHTLCFRCNSGKGGTDL